MQKGLLTFFFFIRVLNMPKYNKPKVVSRQESLCILFRRTKSSSAKLHLVFWASGIWWGNFCFTTISSSLRARGLKKIRLKNLLEHTVNAFNVFLLPVKKGRTGFLSNEFQLLGKRLLVLIGNIGSYHSFFRRKSIGMIGFHWGAATRAAILF